MYYNQCVYLCVKNLCVKNLCVKKYIPKYVKGINKISKNV